MRMCITIYFQQSNLNPNPFPSLLGIKKLSDVILSSNGHRNSWNQSRFTGKLSGMTGTTALSVCRSRHTNVESFIILRAKGGRAGERRGGEGVERKDTCFHVSVYISSIIASMSLGTVRSKALPDRDLPVSSSLKKAGHRLHSKSSPFFSMTSKFPTLLKNWPNMVFSTRDLTNSTEYHPQTLILGHLSKPSL